MSARRGTPRHSAPAPRVRRVLAVVAAVACASIAACASPAPTPRAVASEPVARPPSSPSSSAPSSPSSPSSSFSPSSPSSPPSSPSSSVARHEAVVALPRGSGAAGSAPATGSAIAPVDSAPDRQPDPTADPAADRAAELAALDRAPRYHPALLDQPARPSRIKPGRYKCKVSREYKLRGCRVMADAAGHTLLEIDDGNLVPASGVLFDDGPVVRFEGWLTGKRPFGCFACQDRCFLDPSGCACVPLPAAASRACLAQPVRVELSGAGSRWHGTLEYDHYQNRYDFSGGVRRIAGTSTEHQRLEFTLVR